MNVCWGMILLGCASVARLGLLSSERVECCGSPADTLAHHLDQLLSYSEQALISPLATLQCHTVILPSPCPLQSPVRGTW